MGTTLTPEEYAKGIAYTTSESINAPSSFLNLANSNARTIIAMLFLLTLSLLKATAKVRIKIGLANFFFCLFRIAKVQMLEDDAHFLWHEEARNDGFNLILTFISGCCSGSKMC